MAPMCTPEKQTQESRGVNNLEELYFIPQGNPDEESITDCSDLDDSDDDDVVREKMDNLLATFSELDKHFNLHGQVGEGTFSTVYVAGLKNGPKNQRFAIKHIVPTCHPERIKFELTCLKEIGGSNNVVGVNLCLRNLNNIIFVMPYQQHNYFSEYVGDIDATELKLYMFNLLKALAHVHDFNIIHRDIKPSNFLYDRQNKKFLLVDFGLAQKQSENEAEKHITTGTKRKRTSESQLHGLTQANKRLALQSRADSQAVCVSLSASSQEKENHINKALSKGGATSKSPAVTYISFDGTSGRKTLKNRQQQSEICTCYGKPKVCSLCTVHPPIQASRAGTPGFRPPEVLLKCTHQTTAVDVWAAGIIMLSILSNCSNFSACPNDIAALLELITIFGHDNVMKIASKFGRQFLCSEKKPALDLRKICCSLRGRNKYASLLTGDECNKCQQYKKVCLCKHVPMNDMIADEYPRTAYDLLTRLLDLNPNTRISAREAMSHPFFTVS